MFTYNWFRLLSLNVYNPLLVTQPQQAIIKQYNVSMIFSRGLKQLFQGPTICPPPT